MPFRRRHRGHLVWVSPYAVRRAKRRRINEAVETARAVTTATTPIGMPQWNGQTWQAWNGQRWVWWDGQTWR
jgi:hypothetical protein